MNVTIYVPHMSKQPSNQTAESELSHINTSGRLEALKAAQFEVPLMEHDRFGILVKCPTSAHPFVYRCGPTDCPICAIIQFARATRRVNIQWFSGVYVNADSILRFICNGTRYNVQGEQPLTLPCDRQILVSNRRMADSGVFGCNAGHQWSERHCAPLMAKTVTEQYYGARFDDMLSTELNVTGFNRAAGLIIYYAGRTTVPVLLSRICVAFGYKVIIVGSTRRTELIDEIATKLGKIHMLYPGHSVSRAADVIKQYSRIRYPTSATPWGWTLSEDAAVNAIGQIYMGRPFAPAHVTDTLCDDTEQCADADCQELA